MDTPIKPVALMLMIGAAGIGLLLAPVVLVVFAMSFDSGGTAPLIDWVVRLLVLFLPVIILILDFVAWQAYRQKN